jgi:hypothetical protein
MNAYTHYSIFYDAGWWYVGTYAAPICDDAEIERVVYRHRARIECELYVERAYEREREGA